MPPTDRDNAHMSFRDAVGSAARPFGLLDGTVLWPAGALIMLGAVSLALSRLSLAFTVLGAGLWICGVSIGLAGLLRSRHMRSRH